MLYDSLSSSEPVQKPFARQTYVWRVSFFKHKKTQCFRTVFFQVIVS